MNGKGLKGTIVH